MSTPITTFDFDEIEPLLRNNVIIGYTHERPAMTMILNDGSVLQMTAVLTVQDSDTAVPRIKFTFTPGEQRKAFVRDRHGLPYGASTQIVELEKKKP